ncbi:probable disease resistance protein At4g27220 [Juglans microcarpa x Juglans regia]|uniref:probable disease resistance protein At4g27220 n=1 Tax=Juglans microcarpa x Juglans regia TaxID=2249226 RepID=UPI001B7E98AB|nr:probable disease resistance protein At4g27220 [Juglans microcarpa x Juglans regia]
MGEQFGNIISYKTSIATLEDKIPKLLEKKEAVQQSIDGAQWNQEVVASEVKTWLANVGKRIDEVQKFIEEDVKANRMCLNGWCPDMKLRYSLGKKAQKNTQAIDDLLKEGEKYNRVYNIKAPLEVRSSSTDQRFKDFESRKSMIQNVLDALKDDKINMVALCGMGGIGKTEIAKEIERRVKSDNLFHKIAIAVVSQSPSLTKIQCELAEMLGPRLDAESLRGRANELYSRLTENKNVLVILDDVWEPLDIEAIGVYHAVKEKSCKILLTSRNEETCNWMRIQNIFPVGLLSEEEAWNLFIEMVGDCINTSDLISIAKQVAKECACLPLAIVTVGSALRNKSDKNEWKAALQQLKMSIPHNIYGLHPKVYSSIEFSYNYLESDEAKSCFLLCCLYPEDYDIPVEHLVRYGVAKMFFKGLDTVEQTRVNVNAIVQNLRRSNLLLDSHKVECVKMHDVVRDVAISIASRDESGFMVVLDTGLEEWPRKDRYDSYTTISLLLREMKGYSNGLKCPKLLLLRLSCLYCSKTYHSEMFPGNLFNGMKELKILSLQEGCFSLTSLPPSIQILQNLQMLNLENCRLGDVSAIGTLGKLEILGFRYSEIEELPLEIGNLSRLKLLDMKGCRSLKQIAAGVLSGLSGLEELYMGEFKNWGCRTTMEGNGEVTNNNASLAELIPYSGQLVVLEISVPSIWCLPKELDFSNSNFRFRINGIDNGKYLFENTLKLKVEDASDLGEYRTIRSLLKKAVVLRLDIAKNSKHVWFEKEQKGILPCSLKDLWICRCEDLEYLSEATSDTSPPNTFHLLESLSLNNLPRLIGICNSADKIEVERGGITASKPVAHKLFSSSTILWVPNLEFLHVYDCGSVEVVFDLEGLKVKENRKPILAVLSKLNLRNLSGMSHVWKNIPPGFQGFENLISINIEKCHSLRNLLPASIAKLLVQLRDVKIWDCNLMENIIQREHETGEERIADIIVFPKICSFTLRYLENLVSLSSEAHSLEWPSIKQIELLECPKLKTFGSKDQSGRKLRKVDAELNPRAQEPSAASSSARESLGLFNRCLESCVPRRRNYSPAQGNSNSSLGGNKHDLINKEITLTKQEEQNVSETKMLSLFPYNLIGSLENLQQLSIGQCDSLEVIFELEGLDVEESDIFNNLAVLSLKFLPKLLHIWKKGPRDIKGFNYLRLLLVWGCDSLTCLFTPSIAKLLVKVEKIEVHSCNEMEEILAKESGDEENRDVIAFPLVKTLKFRNLQKLECFYTEDNHAFEWPSLDEITIVGCPKLRMFVSASTKTPKLKGVHMESRNFQPMVEGDLNATIQHIIKGKEEGNGPTWQFTGFYGHPDSGKRSSSWQLLKMLKPINSIAWLCAGDFNEILHQSDKIGGASRPYKQIEDFRQAVECCGLNHIHSYGQMFTWSNNRNGSDFTKEKIDRALGDKE